MSYTPKFQAVLDKCTEMFDGGKPEEEVQSYFFQACVDLGPYERLNNLYRIRPKRPVPGQRSRYQFFRMNLMQETFFKNHTNRDLVLKMRQGGVTTLSCLIALDLCLFNHGFNAAIMAHVQPNVKKYFKITKSAFKWFQKDWAAFYPVAEPIVDNVATLGIRETGSELLVCTEAKGLTLDFLHVAEAAFVEDNRISESIEAVPYSGWVILETTPDTASGMFYDLWENQNKAEIVSFKGHFFPWWYQYPEAEDLPKLKTTPDFSYSEKEELLMREHSILTRNHMIWRRLKISECGNDEGEFMRKYPEDPMTCFLSGSRSYFPSYLLTSLWRNERAPAFYGDLQALS